MDEIRNVADELKKTIADKVETATAEIDSNPVGVIRRRFENLRSVRQPFIDEAKKMAELVVPGMYDGCVTEPANHGTCIFGQPSFETANQSLISKGVLLLSWTMANVILPSDGDYFNRNIEESVAQQLKQMEEIRRQTSAAMGQAGDPPDFIPISEQMNAELLTDDIIVRQHTASSNHQEVLARCIYHSLIGGLSVFGHLTKNEAKTYTIQNSVAVFDSAHEAVEVIVVDRMPLVSLSDSVRKKLIGGVKGEELRELDVSDSFVTIYTQQIRTSPDTLSIRTEIEGIPIDELSMELPVSAPALIALPLMFLNESDLYPIGWLTYNRGDCNAYENLSLSIEGMVAAAATCVMGLPVGAKITTEELRNSPGLSVIPIADAAKRLEIVTAPIAQNLQQILGWHDKKERQLMMIFGMDFAIQRPGERVTAEEIQTMSIGLQKLFGATYKQTERTFQQKHCRRQFMLCEEERLIRPVDSKLYTLSLTAGLQAMEAQKRIGNMDQLVARAAQLGQLKMAGMNKFGDDAMLSWYAHQLKIDTEGKILTPEQEAEQLGVAQFLQMARQLGPQGPGMLAQMIGQMMQGGPTGGPANQAA